jgi:succinoglycan biosynthesis protein ExoL
VPTVVRQTLVYFVHDLSDAAVRRRVRMVASEFDVRLIGFRRSPVPVTDVEGVTPFDLGRTWDGRFGQRLLAVLRAALRSRDLGEIVSGADVVMARQLEMLVLAVLARRRYAPGARLVFECLDIHRLLLRKDAIGFAMRAIEGRMLRACDRIVVSSPAFLSEYFERRHRFVPPPLVLENRVLASEMPRGRQPRVTERDDGDRPWRIGWFGMLRCRRSLLALARLLRECPGKVEVVLRGRPSRTAIPEFDAVVAATPGMTFLGPYDRATDLATIYADVDFAWAMDFFEAPGNSEWLLPNRLYEATLHGAVPIALRSVETGRWLERRNCGVLIDEPVDEHLIGMVRRLDWADLAAARERVANVPLTALVDGPEACAAAAAMLAGETGGVRPTRAQLSVVKSRQKR